MTSICPRYALSLLLGGCLACSEPGALSPDARIVYDADPNRPDAQPPICPEASLEIGGCEQEPDSGVCTGSPDNTRFVTIPDGGPIPVVVGPQGIDMIVFSLRTGGIAPGDLDNPASTDRPDVSIVLIREDENVMSHYTGRPSFLEFGSGAVNQEAIGVFMLVEAGVTSGEYLRAVAEVTDQNGEYRCGNLNFHVAL